MEKIAAGIIIIWILGSILLLLFELTREEGTWLIPGWIVYTVICGIAFLGCMLMAV